MNELITIVVPIYKVERYLSKCINSIINQTYKNIEVILVDDGSPDRCGEICDYYAKEDFRIKVIHKNNGGLSDARNIGIDNAKGKYISFIDSDDFIDKDYIEILYNNLINNNAEISICKVRDYDEKSNSFKIYNDHIYTNVYDNKEALKKMCYNQEISNRATNTLYKIELFKSIRFPVGKIYEDLDTKYRLFLSAKNIVVTNQRKYNYLFNREDSITGANFSEKRMDAYYIAKDMVKNIISIYPDLENAAIARMYMELLYIYVEIPNKKKYKKYIRIIKEDLNKYRISILMDNNMPRKFKLFSLVTILGLSPTKYLWIQKKRFLQ